MSGALAGRPIVAGLDGSEIAGEAARWAAAEAALRSVPLRLVHAVDVTVFAPAGGFVPPQGFFEALRAEGRQWLEEMRTALASRHPELDIDIETGFAQPASLLIERSEEAGLVVVGAHGAGLDTALAGSVPIALAAYGRCPVAVVPAGWRERDAVGEGPVVVGVDGSRVSEAAVELAFEEASLRRASVVAVHAWGEPGHRYVVSNRFELDWPALEARERELLVERLAGWREKYPDVPVRSVLAKQRPARSLLDQSETAALLVVGSRGRGGFVGMLLGSTSRTLVNYARCPVIVARPPS